MNIQVLVVDDSSTMRAIVSSVVSSCGYTPVPAATGEEAIGLFRQHRIDLVVMDVEMPGINGFETCRQLRKLSEDWFPVIYLSAANSDEHIIEGLDAGGDAYVAKPINDRVLKSILTAMGRIAIIQSKLDQANKSLEHLATHDSLTQVLNRRGFDEILERCWRQSQREQTVFSIILADIDFFKKYNDYYGHGPGDECLHQVAQCLKSALLRPGDQIARYGGEEFVILLAQTDAAGAEEVAQRLQTALAKTAIPHEQSEVADHVTLSQGIADSQHRDGMLDILKAADDALYQTKRTGRNGYACARPAA